MKIRYTILLFIIFALVSMLALQLENNADGKIDITNSTYSTQNEYEANTAYQISVKYSDDMLFDISEKIEWQNVSEGYIDTLYLNAPAVTDVKNNLNPFNKYEIAFISINGIELKYNYIECTKQNFIDSSLIVLVLPAEIKNQNNYKIEIEYRVHFKSSIHESHFHNFENWYFTFPPFINNEFVKYSNHNFINSFLDYSNYDVQIELPKEYKIATSGNSQMVNNGSVNILKTKAYQITRFSWFAFKDLIEYKKNITINNSPIEVKLFISSSKDNYIDRYFDAATKYLNDLDTYGKFPNETITLIDLPNSKIENKSYPNLIALNTDLVSPTKTQKLEYKLAVLFAEQYFGNIIASNSLEESWLMKGVSSYLAEKMVANNYGNFYSFFTFGDYYPVYGLHFMSYAGIPIIYTISDHIIPEGGRFIEKYYNNLAFANLSTYSYKQPNTEAYNVSSNVKPQLALLTYENIIGSNKFRENLISYSKQYMFKHPTSNDFRRKILDGVSESGRAIYDEIFETDKSFDYAIRSITKRENDLYDILVERVEEGVIPIKLNVYTEYDTLNYFWDGKDRVKIFTVKSYDEIIAAELDSENKNILDLSFANNSYIVEEQYWGSISYATRVFFWFQNALMLIGGKG